MITTETDNGKKIVIGDGKNKFEKMDLDRDVPLSDGGTC